MFNLRNIILSLTETSPKASEKAEKDSKQFGSGLEKGPNLVGKDSLTPAQLQARKSAGVPDDAIGAPGGRWYSRDGKTYLGRTVDGKFQPKGEDDEKKVAQRGGFETGDVDRSQQARTNREKRDTADAQSATPQQRAKNTATKLVDKLQKQWGAASLTTHSSSKYKEMLAGANVGKNPLPNASKDDEEVIGVPLDTYMKTTGAKSRREIDAVGKYNQKYGGNTPSDNGAPLGTYDGEDGSSWVIMRKRKGMFEK